MLFKPWHFRCLFSALLLICTVGFLKDVSNVPSGFMPNDKLMHLLIFLLLMGLWQLSFYGRTLIGFVLLALYGGAVELAQHFYTSRFGDWWDLLAGMAGLALALLLWQLPFWRKFAPAKAQELQ